MIDPNVKPKNKSLQENKVTSLLWGRQRFLKHDRKSANLNKVNKFDFIKLRTSIINTHQ